MTDESRSFPSRPLPEASLNSFPPLVNGSTHTLVLGSMPGRVSLAEHQYYAHPRNGFWHIMGELFGADFTVPYPQRIAILLDHGIGLWDVIGSCTRTTSLDSDIVEDSIQVNDFGTLLTTYPRIRRILFNGTKAEQCFHRYARPHVIELLTHLSCRRLISTSPANARYSIADKIRLWSAILAPGSNAPPSQHLF